MKPCAPYLYEFLWRGHPPGDKGQAGWHVQIEQRLAVDDKGNATPHVRTLGVKQATAEGWDLRQIGATIDAAALVELEDARTTITRLEQERDDAREQLAKLRERLDEDDDDAEGKKDAA